MRLFHFHIQSILALEIPFNVFAVFRRCLCVNRWKFQRLFVVILRNTACIESVKCFRNRKLLEYTILLPRTWNREHPRSPQPQPKHGIPRQQEARKPIEARGQDKMDLTQVPDRHRIQACMASLIEVRCIFKRKSQPKNKRVHRRSRVLLFLLFDGARSFLLAERVRNQTERLKRGSERTDGCFFACLSHTAIAIKGSWANAASDRLVVRRPHSTPHSLISVWMKKNATGASPKQKGSH